MTGVTLLGMALGGWLYFAIEAAVPSLRRWKRRRGARGRNRTGKA